MVVFFVVFLSWCLCSGVFVVVFCVRVFVEFCGVFVVVFVWWCGGAFVVFFFVVLWWCFCGGVFVVFL